MAIPVAGAPTMTDAAIRTRKIDERRGIEAAAGRAADRVLADLDVTTAGLTGAQARSRLETFGPNAVSSHRARALSVLWHQLRSPLLALLAIAATASYFVGQRNDAVIIAVIVLLSIGLGFGNEYRAEKAAEALHSQIRHQAIALRDGQQTPVDVTALVPGDIVDLRLGDIVPADIRLLELSGLECDESVLTGESMPVAKDPAPVALGMSLGELTSCALMGTVVHAGQARGVVVATGAATAFGTIAAGLNTHPLETEFQAGLRKFSMLLVYVAGTLTTSIFAINVVLHKPIMQALLFSLAIAVGITPQLLPAVVSTSLAAGSRRMRQRKVLIKRLVCIEDLGDVDVLFTDKTGTLTDGTSNTCARSRRARCQAVMSCVGVCCAPMPLRSTGEGSAVTRLTMHCGSARPQFHSGPRWPATHACRNCRLITSGGWFLSWYVTGPANRPWSPKERPKLFLIVAARCQQRSGPHWRGSSQAATGSSRWRPGRCKVTPSSRPSTSRGFNWWDSWSSSTHPNATPDTHCGDWPISESP
jgi:hypothetical protein